MSRSNSKTKLTPRQKSRPGDKKSSTDLEAGKKVETPQLAWRVLSEPVMRKLKDVSDIDDVAKKLSNILSLSSSEGCLEEAAELDYFVTGYWCAMHEWHLTAEQTSAFITILHMLLNNVKVKNLSLVENVKELQSLLCTVGVPGMATSLECFTYDESTTVIQYIETTLFQHYTLFQCLYTHKQQTDTLAAQLKIEFPNVEETPIFPPPLEESIPVELHERCTGGTDSKKDETTTRELVKIHPRYGELTHYQELTTGSKDRLLPSDIVADALASIDEKELEMSPEDLKTMIEDMAKTTLESFQTQMIEKIKEKEDLIVSKISKLEKAL